MNNIIKIVLFDFLMFNSPFITLGQAIFLDSTFGINGKVISDMYGSDYCKAGVIQNDGKIILVGASDVSQPHLQNFIIARYNEDGFLDSTFSSNGFDSTGVYNHTDAGNAVAIQADGKIIVTGSSYIIQNNRFATIRYKNDGTLDSTFGTNGKVSTLVGGGSNEGQAVALTQNGKIIVGGQCYDTTYNCALVQYNSDGSLDTMFGNGGIVITSLPEREIGYSLAVQPDGKILLAGAYSSSIFLGGFPGAFLLIRYNNDGSLDNTFNGTGILLDSTAGHNATSMILQPDGKIVLGGVVMYQGFNRFALSRYNSDGSIDFSFGSSGKVVTSIGNADCAINSIALQSDGKILAAGFAGIYGNTAFTVIRYDSNGIIDSSFGSNGMISNTVGPSSNNVTDVLLQPSGKIILCGRTYNSGSHDFSMIRYDNNFSSTVNNISELNNDLSVLPNPMITESKIVFQNSSRSKFTFRLFDITGRVIETYSTTENEINLSKGSKSPGLYHYNLLNESTGEILNGKIVIN